MPKPNVYMSIETLNLFRQFLSSASVSVNEPDFEEAARIASLAKRELAVALDVVNNRDNGPHNPEIEDQTKTDTNGNASAASRPSKRS